MSSPVRPVDDDASYAPAFVDETQTIVSALAAVAADPSDSSTTYGGRGTLSPSHGSQAQYVSSPIGHDSPHFAKSGIGTSSWAMNAFNNPPAIIGLPLAANIQHLAPPLDNGSNDQEPGPQDSALYHCTDLNLQATSGSQEMAEYPTVSPNQMNSVEADLSNYQQNPRISPQLWTSDAAFPTISHSREAYLVKFYAQTWGPIFDCLDAESTFSTTVVEIALTSSQQLLWAILATAALQLSRVSNYPASAAQLYRSQCSKSVLPMLLASAEPNACEETLFATYVMLRNYEQMTECLSEKNPSTLFTASLAIAANPNEPSSAEADLGRAAFWVHLRQDIHIALLLMVAIRSDYSPCLQRDKIVSDLSLIADQKTALREREVDCAWANHMAMLLADIINHCFTDGPRRVDAWVALRGRLDHWTISKPPKFRPYYERERAPQEGRVFPDIWIVSDCHVIAWLYFHTATILLKVYTPESRSTIMEPNFQNLAVREEVLTHARAICGIVTTNPNAQALIMLCHMVTISAVFFTDKAEQVETIKLLHMAHEVTGHPCNEIEATLRSFWQRNPK